MGDHDAGLREQVEALQAVIERQDDVIRRQEERLAALERTAPIGDPVVDEPPTVVWDGTTDRRHLLSRAATVAAGAAVGGTALALGQASPAAAAQGIFDGNPAVVANGIGGYAVQAISDTGGAIVASNSNSSDTVTVSNYSALGRAIYGSGKNCGVFGVCPSGAGSGVVGTAYDGYGVEARVNAAAARAQLWLTGLASLPVPPSRSDFHIQGEVVFDVNEDLWLCTANGNPGTWRRVSGANTAGALTLLSSPVRVYDSRPGNPPVTGPKTPLANGASRTVDCTNNASGVPVGATGVLANVSVVNTSTTGFLAAFKTGTAVPGTSTINWFQVGSIVANTTVVACDATAHIDCYVPPTSSTDFFIDVIGFFR